ncbi:MAG: 50S ribosomal protein L11 methyltransferase [Deltaproteobacteria bacterium]|nr:50S ribosomal protein L11 methyltransferase [Deltaproteobacteria bacterium]
MTDKPNSALPRYPRVVIDVPPDDADVMSAMLFELGADGVEERDDGTLQRATMSGCVTLIGSFETHADALAAVQSLPPELSPRIDEVIGDAWRDAWKEQFHPFHVSPGIVVCPPWESYAPQGSERVLVLEPGRAFGTGLHATTSLVVGAIERHAAEMAGREVLDVGCGTGILALASLMLGASKARATDNDADVIPVVVENAERNGFAGRIEADTCDVLQLQGAYPVVVANIEARVLIGMAAPLCARVAPGGLLILSGVLDTQKDDVAQAYAPMQMEHVSQRDEWVALELRKAR